MTESERPAEHLTEEPQGERGESGARDEGFAPGEGPADRPEGQTGADTTVDKQETAQADMPDAATGDQGG